MGKCIFTISPKELSRKRQSIGYEIPNVFNIDEDEYSKLIADLYNHIKQLRQIWFHKTR